MSKKNKSKQPASWDEPMEDESASAFRAFTDYCHLGTRRSIVKLHKAYLETEKQNQWANNKLSEMPPTTMLKTLQGWSMKYKWQARVKQYDEYIIEKTRVESERRRQAVIDNGWRDYDNAVTRYHELLERSKLHTRRTVGFVNDPDNPGEKIKVITLQIPAKDELAIAKLRKEIELLGRAAAGLPPDNRQIRIGNIEGETLDLTLPGLADEMQAAFTELREQKKKRKAAAAKDKKKRRTKTEQTAESDD